MSSSESIWDELDDDDADDEAEAEDEDEEDEEEDEEDEGFSWLGMEADPMTVVTA